MAALSHILVMSEPVDWHFCSCHNSDRVAAHNTRLAP